MSNPPKPTTFTEQQISDWQAYEKVRKSGRFNMLTPQAGAATKLPKDRYWFVLENYEELEKAQPKQ
jgi:hypothetical protein